MKRIGVSKLLGIALGPTALTVAELASHGQAVSVLRTAELIYSPGGGLDHPSELGAALAGFLRQKGFSTRRAVIGLSAKWLITRRRAVPPAAPQMAAGGLRLYAEGEFSAELADLAIDFAGQTSDSETATVLVMATGKTQIDQCQAMAKAAGLRLAAITATGNAMAWLSGLASQGAHLAINVHRDEAELVVHRDGVPSQIRHVPLADPQQVEAVLAGELRRTLAGLGGAEKPASLSVWGGGQELSALRSALAERLGLQVDAPQFRGLTPDGESDAAFAAAIALAMAGLRGAPEAVDFLDSRLAAPPERSTRPLIIWGSVAAALAVLAIGGALVHLQQQNSQLAEMRAWQVVNKQAIQEATTAAKRLETAQAWLGGKPRVLACMGALTNLFPNEGSIWATSLSLRLDITPQDFAGHGLAGQISGRASNKQQPLQLSDDMRNNKSFTDVKTGEVRDAGQNVRESTFSISFVYRIPE